VTGAPGLVGIDLIPRLKTIAVNEISATSALKGGE
jgi:hypothetical protein